MDTVNEDTDMEIDDSLQFKSTETKSERAGEQDQKNLDLVPCWNEAQAYSPRLTPTETPNVSEKPEKENSESQFWSSNEAGHDGQDSIKSYHADDEGSVLGDDVPWLDIQAKAALRRVAFPRGSETDNNSSEDTSRQLSAAPKVPPPTPTEEELQIRRPLTHENPGSFQRVAEAVSRQDDITDTVGGHRDRLPW